MRLRILPAVVVIVGLAFLAACAAPPTPAAPVVATVGAVAEKAADAALVNTEWQLETMWPPPASTPVVPGTDVTLGFLVDRYAGFGGCDWYMGMYSLTGNQIFIQQPAKTIAGCINKPQATDQQGSFMGMLTSAVTYEVKDGKLILYNTEKQQMVSMTPLEALPFEGTTWQALFYFTTDGGVWNPALPGAKVTAVFDGKTISGNAGCNDYSATYTRTGDRLQLGPVTATQKTCATPDGVMEQEQGYLKMLQTVGAIQQYPRSVELRTADNMPLLAFKGE